METMLINDIIGKGVYVCVVRGCIWLQIKQIQNAWKSI